MSVLGYGLMWLYGMLITIKRGMNSIEFRETNSKGVTGLITSVRIVPSTKPTTLSISQQLCVWYSKENRFTPSLLLTSVGVLSEYAKFKGYDADYVMDRTIHPTDEYSGSFMLRVKMPHIEPICLSDITNCESTLTHAYAQILKRENVLNITGVEEKDGVFRLVIEYGEVTDDNQ